MKWFNEAVRGHQEIESSSQTEKMYREILEHIPDKIVRTDLDRRVEWANRAVNGVSNEEETVGRFCYEILYGHENPCQGCPREKAVESLEVTSGMVQFEKDGIPHFNQVTAIPILEKDKDLIGMIEICRDVTDQVQQKRNAEIHQRELENAKKIADTANAEKTKFITNICHEIRTPLNGVMGMTQLLRVTELNDNQMEYVTLLNQSSIRLMQTVEAISEISKHDEIIETPSNSVFSLDGLLDELSVLFALKADSNHISLQFFYDSEIPKRVNGDAYRIYQALSNIIDNAIKFTSEGKVVVSTHLLEKTAEEVEILIMVKDTGVGIPSDKIGGVFERFAKEGSMGSLNSPGMGLGLAITQHIVEVLGGRIEIESEVDEGTRVKLFLRLKYLPDFINPTKNLEVPEQPVRRDGKRRILIAEDEVMNRLTFKMVLKDTYELIFAKNGKEALELFVQEKPDLMILDIMMPVMDGFKVLDEIERKGAHVPIIACTARVFDAEPSYLTGYGFADYLAKPVDVEQLKRMIKNHLY